MNPETASILNKLRLEFLKNSEKDDEHCKTLHPGGAKRLAMSGSARGWERAARRIEQEIIAHATNTQPNTPTNESKT
jgi:hypothetical protein